MAWLDCYDLKLKYNKNLLKIWQIQSKMKRLWLTQVHKCLYIDKYFIDNMIKKRKNFKKGMMKS